MADDGDVGQVPDCADVFLHVSEYPSRVGVNNYSKVYERQLFLFYLFRNRYLIQMT